MTNLLREAMRKDIPVYGAFVTLRDPSIVEIVGISGYDFVGVELEHSPTSLETLQDHLRAARASQLGALARIGLDEPAALLRVLDSGVDGVLLSRATSAAEVEAGIAECRYPPSGRRGFSSITRAADFGGLVGELRPSNAAEHAELVVGVIVEHAALVAEIHDLVAIDGLDFICIGPADLSASMGLAGQRGHPEVAEKVASVVAACVDAGVPVAMPVDHPACPYSGAELLSLGVGIILVTTDAPVLVNGFRSALRQAMSCPDGAVGSDRNNEATVGA